MTVTRGRAASDRRGPPDGPTGSAGPVRSFPSPLSTFGTGDAGDGTWAQQGRSRALAPPRPAPPRELRGPAPEAEQGTPFPSGPRGPPPDFRWAGQGAEEQPQAQAPLLAVRLRPAGSESAAPPAVGMEAVPRMPMIWLDLKEAGEFGFQQAVKQVRPRAGPGRWGGEPGGAGPGPAWERLGRVAARGCREGQAEPPRPAPGEAGRGRPAAALRLPRRANGACAVSSGSPLGEK